MPLQTPLLDIKIVAHNALRRSRELANAAARAMPGVARRAYLPTYRIRSLRRYVEDEKAAVDWWLRPKVAHYYALHPECEVRRRPPTHINGVPHADFIRELFHVHSEVFLARLPGARILGPSGLVITSDGGAVEESTWGHGWLERDRAYRSLRLPRPQYCPGQFYTLTTLFDEGYPHWLLEALPRLIGLANFPPDEITVLVSRDLTPIQRETLSALGFGRYQFQPINDSHLQVELLHFPSYAGEPGNAHPWACAWLRDKLIGRQVPSSRPRRIYVTRRLAQRRRILNEHELAPLLERHGFEFVEAERLSFSEQMHLFSQAECVVAPHGAGLANLIFSPAGCRVLEIFDPAHVRVMYYALADALKQHYFYIFAETVDRKHGHGSSGHADIFVSVALFQRALSVMLQDHEVRNF